MRFLLDQNIDARVIPYLAGHGHDVKRVARDYPPGLPDSDVLSIAHQERRILITHDRHFGELVFVRHRSHADVILLRLGPFVPLDTIIDRLDYVVSQHTHELDQFIVVTHHLVRVRR